MILRPAPGVRQIVAPNPSPMTGPGTNGYVIGTEIVALVDPGPDDDRHLDAWLRAIRGEAVSHILVTHAHRDHSALAQRLAASVSAPVLAFGRWDEGRSETMRRLSGIGGGEGTDDAFVPDARLADGDVLTGPNWRIEVLHTPGHFPGHLAFATEDCVLSGDHVLGWTSTLISPPDGDLRQFLASCDQLRAIATRPFLPGHGDLIGDPVARLDWVVAHRLERDDQIAQHLRESGASRVPAIVQRLYGDTPRALWPAAARSVLAHLIAMVEEGRVTAEPELRLDAVFRPI